MYKIFPIFFAKFQTLQKPLCLGYKFQNDPKILIDLDRNWQEFEIYWVNWCISFLYTLDDKFKLDLTASIFSIFGLTSLSWVRCGIMPPQLKNNFQYRIIILKNKPKFWQTNLVCLLEFWFVCQNFGLFVSILVCLPAFWFVCQHFG